MRIGVIHATLNAVKPLEEAFQAVNPSITVVNFVNEELLAHANRVGGVDGWGIRSFTRIIMEAAEAEVDAILIACSIYSTFAEQVQFLTDKPVIAVDTPMIKEAVEKGTRIGVIATTASAGPLEEKKLLEEAKGCSKQITTRVEICTEAMDALKRGDSGEHDRILREAAQRLEHEGCDVIVLSQITMARAKNAMEGVKAIVLTSPESGARYFNAPLRMGTPR